jgi:hypothetical protein
MTTTVRPYSDGQCDECNARENIARIGVGGIACYLCPSCLADLHRLTAPPGDRGEVVAPLYVVRVVDSKNRREWPPGSFLWFMEEESSMSRDPVHVPASIDRLDCAEMFGTAAKARKAARDLRRDGVTAEVVGLYLAPPVVPLVAGPSEADGERAVSPAPSAVVVDAVTARVLAAGGVVGQAAEDAVANVVAVALEAWGATVLADARGEIRAAGLAAIGGGR